MARRSALIVANASYADPRLSKLRAPARDAKALARVLGDPAIGGFDLDLAVNDVEHVLRRRIGKFFADRERDDLLVLHMSCHGLKDDEGQLYFAAADTRVDELDATAVSAEYVNRRMTRCRSRRIVLLLDCCYSGAFARGMTARAGDLVDVKERFEGRGRAVLTASSAIEYSFEGDELSGRGNPSVFTSAVVRALETGDADRDRDSWISVNELYDYVYSEVRGATPKQRPHMWLFDVEGDLHIARAVGGASSVSADAPAAVGPMAISPSSSQGRAAGDAGRLVSARHAVIAGVLVLLAMGATVAVIVAAGGSSRHQSAGLSATVATTQPASAPTTHLMSDVATEPYGVAAQGYSVWLSDFASGVVRRFDTGADNVNGQLRVGGQPSWLAIEYGIVWVPSQGAGTVTLLRASRKLKATKTIDVGPGAYSVAVAADTAWVVNTKRNTVTRINTTTNQVEPPSITVGHAPRGVAADAGGAWVANSGSNTVTHIGADGSVLGTISVGKQPNGVTETTNQIVWVANSGDNSITRISAATGKVIGHPIKVGSRPFGITFGGGFVWVTDSASGDVRRFNASTGHQVGKPIGVGSDPTSIAVAGNSAWVANRGDQSLTEIDFKPLSG